MASAPWVEETTFTEVDGNTPPARSGWFSRRTPKPPPDRAEMVVICSLIMLGGMVAAYAGFLLASNPEEAFSAPQSPFGGSREIRDAGDIRVWSLIQPVLIVGTLLCFAVFWHKRRTFRNPLDRSLAAGYYPSMLLLISLIATILLVGGIVTFAIATISVFRVHWFSLPFAYFLAVAYSRPGRPWHRWAIIATFLIWLSMGPALDLPPPSIAKVVYNIAGWLAIAFVTPYLLWCAHFPSPVEKAYWARQAGSQATMRTGYSPVAIGAVGIVGLVLLFMPIAGSFSTPEPRVTGWEGHPVEGYHGLPGPSLNKSWIYANRSAAVISVRMLNYGGADAKGIFIEIHGRNETQNSTMVHRAGPIGIPGCGTVVLTYKVNYTRYISMSVMFEANLVDGIVFDFEDQPYPGHDGCAIMLLLPVALALPKLLARKMRRGR